MFTKEEREMMILALQMRRNLIQTGDASVSVKDIERMGTKAAAEFGAGVRPLEDSQIQCVIDTDCLITKLINMGV